MFDKQNEDILFTIIINKFTDCLNLLALGRATLICTASLCQFFIQLCKMNISAISIHHLRCLIGN